MQAAPERQMCVKSFGDHWVGAQTPCGQPVCIRGNISGVFGPPGLLPQDCSGRGRRMISIIVTFWHFILVPPCIYKARESMSVVSW